MRTAARSSVGTVLLALTLVAGPAAAIDFEKLVMPGDLASAHADLEDDCSNCHAPLSRDDQALACQVCHEEVAADIANEQGHHGLHPDVAASDCRVCHPDHRGREFDMLGLDPAAFDHAFTDFALEGAHRAAACGSCHEAGKKHREAPGDCFACHEDDDAHRGELGEDCGSCHQPTAWLEAEYDHDESGWPLVGHHRDAQCGLCHVGQRYEATPTDCIDCHRVDDAHEGRFGEDCGSCHDPKGWQKGSFDHSQTDFPLEGHHVDAQCESCHVEPPDQVDLPTDCFSCHRLDDAHRGGRGEDCGECHSPADWAKPRFDHEKESGFALVEAHAELDCRSCHPVSTEQAIGDETCASCHTKDDVHEGELRGGCDQCHGQKTWSADIRFDHDLARFPLLGLHASLACEECHGDPKLVGTPSACIACHGEDDTHEAKLGPGCQDCHTPNGWAVWEFDHDTRTRFELHGRHEGIACESCHRWPTQDVVRAPSSCVECHARDDAHRGSFGRQCGACHHPDGWEKARFPGLRGRPPL